MALAQAVIGLTRETGWSEKFILEELPLARFLLYRHAIAYGHGAYTVAVGPAGEPVDEQMATLGV